MKFNTNLIKIRVIGIFVCILIIAIFTFIFTQQKRSLNQQTPSVVETGVEKPNKLQQVVYVGQQPSFPKQVGIYQTNTISNPINQVNVFVKDFELKPSEFSINNWVNQEKKISLSFSPDENRISLVFLPTNSELKISLEKQFGSINMNKAIFAAESFLQKHQLIGFSPGNNPIYLTQEGILNTNQGAESILIPFNFSIDNIKAVYGKGYQSPLNVVVNSNYSIQKLELHPLPQDFELKTLAPLLTIDDVLILIKNGNAEILTASSENTPLELTKLTTLTLNGVELEYRFVETQLKYLPYYRFTGIGSVGEERMTEVEIIIPAVKL